jgi:signal transduction histidine kinase
VPVVEMRFSRGIGEFHSSAGVIEPPERPQACTSLKPYSMPRHSQPKFYTEIQNPAAEALDLLAPHARRIAGRWRRELRAMGAHTQKNLSSLPLDFGGFSATLKRYTYTAFRERIEGFGQTLSRAGVSAHTAAAALSRLFEACLAEFPSNGFGISVSVLALVRLRALVELLILSAYSHRRGAATAAVASGLAEESSRPPPASAHLAEIYEEERRRLSRDLHDEIGHDLLLIKLHLETMAKENLSRNLSTRFPEAIGLVSHAIDAVRRLVQNLGPAVLEDLGFLPAVCAYVHQFSKRAKIKIKLRTRNLPSEIPSVYQVALYHLLQSALANVVQHASSSQVKVLLGSAKGSGLKMVVEDNGVGFDVSARLAAGSFGLTAMRERVEALGGKIRFSSRLESRGARRHGTRIEVNLPLFGSKSASKSR